MGYIYKITNKINGKGYVGVTTQKDPQIRWRQHELCAKKTNGCPLLSAAILKHGIENFNFEVLIICFDEDVFHYEVEYIAKYNTLAPAGYNGSSGGKFGDGFKGHKHSEEAKKRISQKSKEHNSNPEVRKAHSESLKRHTQSMHEAKRKKKEEAINKLVEDGMSIEEATKQVKRSYSHYVDFKTALERKQNAIKKLIDSGISEEEATKQINEIYAIKEAETKKKVSESLKKYHQSKDKDAIKEAKEKAKAEGTYKPRKSHVTSSEAKAKLSEAMKKYHKEKEYTEEISNKRKSLMASKFGKKLNQYSLDGTLVNTFASINEASRQLTLHKIPIQQCLKTEEKLAYGFRWELVQ